MRSTRGDKKVKNAAGRVLTNEKTPLQKGAFRAAKNSGKRLGQDERADDDDAQRDAVPAEGLEAVLFDEIHEEADRQQGNAEGDGAAEQQIHDLHARKSAAFEQEFENFDKAGAEHDGDGEEKGEFRGGGAGDADENGA